ncbi:MAG TPA: Y-family DNA polymerase [Chitinophagaceae bacterium]|nr:Y-family DNA polymerase [Chitinophagaceae bacterium]
MYALVDCNNFYASCERVFNPRLEGQPIIVLSNNDGCAIARSEEAKALGIEMGTPAFMIETLIKEKNVRVFSSNYALYGDMSDRVMEILAWFAPAVELYSIDEAFLDFTGMQTNLDVLANELRNTVKQHTRIPVSVGIAPTKTLAKMANRYAKKILKTGICQLQTKDDIDVVLNATAVGDIWGIGPERAKLCLRSKMKTAADLAQAPEEWVRKQMSVVGQRLLNELNGIPSIEWELESPPKKNITTSRSFGKLMTEKKDIVQAVSNYTAACAEKLRAQHSCAKKLHLFLQTNPHRTEDRQYFRSLTVPLTVATNHTPELVKIALWALNRIFRPGFNYMKCGVIVQDLVPENEVQAGMFDKRDRPKEKQIMQVLDGINKSFGPDYVRFAVQGYEKRYKLRQAYLSPRYTTRIEDIVKIKA